MNKKQLNSRKNLLLFLVFFFFSFFNQVAFSLETPFVQPSVLSEVAVHANAPLPPHVEGYFSISFFNETKQAFNPQQIYFQFLAENGFYRKFVSVKLTGEKTPQGYSIGTFYFPNESEFFKPIPAFTLADLKDGILYLPDHPLAGGDANGPIYRARIYISMNKPLSDLELHSYTGFKSPSLDPLANSKDIDTPYDWFEFTYDSSRGKDGGFLAPFNANLTQVDMFSLPLWFKATDVKGLNTSVTGFPLRDTVYAPVYLESRDEVFQLFNSYTKGTPFLFEKLKQGLSREKSPARVIAPYFNLAHFNQEYFNSYINEFWSKYRDPAHPFKFCTQDNGTRHEFGDCFTGFVNKSNQFQFTHYIMAGDTRLENNDCTQASPCHLKNPVTNPPPGISTLQCTLFENCFAYEASTGMWHAAFNVQIMSAINRHVATETYSDGSGFARWHDNSIFYRGEPKNSYASFWHTIGVMHQAYGMPYDDSGDESSDKGLSGKLENIKIGIGW